MIISLWIASGVLLLLTLIPLSHHDAWWVRGLDFPRLQFSLAALGLLAVQVSVLDFSRSADWTMVGLTLLCLGYQVSWILPYTRLYPKEVQWASTSPRPADRDNRIAILVSNVLTPNRHADKLITLVREHRPDILVTLESDSWWQTQLDVLEPGYPHTAKCPRDNLYGMHVYSRYPMENTRVQFLVEDDVPSIHARVALPSGRRIAMHFMHPAPPSPTENDSSSERDAELLVVAKSVLERDTPVIVTGDLNDVAWSATTRLFRKVSGLLDPRVGRGMFNSYHASNPLIRWPLDHLFHSDHFVLDSVRRLPAIGSDHFPVLMCLVCREETSQEGLEADAEDKALAREKIDEQKVTKDDVFRPESG